MDKTTGIYPKYDIIKMADGTQVEGAFVLRPDRDEAARYALLAYAEHTDNANLAADIRAMLKSIAD